ncbi:hypothetical protein ACFL0W_04395 [Nanoarchaeota archaeon]
MTLDEEILQGNLSIDQLRERSNFVYERIWVERLGEGKLDCPVVEKIERATEIIKKKYEHSDREYLKIVSDLTKYILTHPNEANISPENEYAIPPPRKGPLQPYDDLDFIATEFFVDKAIRFHAKQRRRRSKDVYATHPIGAARIRALTAGSYKAIIEILLHDVIEEEIREARKEREKKNLHDLSSQDITHLTDEILKDIREEYLQFADDYLKIRAAGYKSDFREIEKVLRLMTKLPGEGYATYYTRLSQAEKNSSVERKLVEFAITNKASDLIDNALALPRKTKHLPRGFSVGERLFWAFKNLYAIDMNERKLNRFYSVNEANKRKEDGQPTDFEYLPVYSDMIIQTEVLRRVTFNQLMTDIEYLEGKLSKKRIAEAEKIYDGHKEKDFFTLMIPFAHFAKALYAEGKSMKKPRNELIAELNENPINAYAMAKSIAYTLDNKDPINPIERTKRLVTGLSKFDPDTYDCD